VCVGHLYLLVCYQKALLLRKCPYLIYMIGINFNLDNWWEKTDTERERN